MYTMKCVFLFYVLFGEGKEEKKKQKKGEEKSEKDMVDLKGKQ